MIPENNSNKKGTPKGDGPKLPKFNVYWIYGLIALSLLSARFFQMAPDIITTTEQEFKQVMLTRGDVERIDLVQNKELVRVY
ncbi:MAG: AAA family ATPase, partial [Chitinophagaceae bacterium]